MTKETRILAVDDEPIIGELLRCGLEAPHRTVMVAADGREALAMAAKQKFDVVITDHRMPQVGGLEFVRKLRRRRFGGKIIVLSGHVGSDKLGMYEGLGIDKLISKPCDMAELRGIVDDLEEGAFDG